MKKPARNHPKRLKLLFLSLTLTALPLPSVAQNSQPDTQPPAQTQEPSSEEPSKDESLWSIVGNVVIYMALLFAVGAAIIQLSKRGKPLLGSKSSKSGLKVLDTHVLGNKQFLVVVEYENEKILLGVGPGMINKLSNLNSPQKNTPPDTL